MSLFGYKILALVILFHLSLGFVEASPPRELTEEYVKEFLKKLPPAAKAMAEKKVWRDYRRYEYNKMSSISKKELKAVKEGLFSRFAEIADLGTWKYTLNLSKVYEEEILDGIKQQLNADGITFVTYTDFGRDVFWREYFTEANEERIDEECGEGLCMGVKVIDSENSLTTEMILRKNISSEYVTKIPELDRILKESISQIAISRPWFDMPEKLAEAIFSSFSSLGMVGSGDRIGREESEYVYFVSDDDAWYRLKEEPFTAIRPNDVIQTIPEGTQVAVLDKVIAGNGTTVAKIKLVNEDRIEYTTLTNLSKVTEMSNEIKFRMLKDYQALRLPHSTNTANKTYAKDVEFTASKKCGNFIKVKSEGAGEIEGHWILKSATVALEPEFPVSADQLEEIFPNTSSDRINEVVTVLNEFSNDFNITTRNRMAHFLGQIGHESNSLKSLIESHNYSAKSIYQTFLKVERSKTGGGMTYKYCHLIKSYDCSDLSSCPSGYKGPNRCTTELDWHTDTEGNFASYTDWTHKGHEVKSSFIKSSDLFDLTYCCRLGNSHFTSKEGSKYRGRGFVQITGKKKYKLLTRLWNEKFPQDVKDFVGNDYKEVGENVRVAMIAALFEWERLESTHKSFAGALSTGWSDANIKTISRLVNGSGTDESNGESDRLKKSNKAYESL